MEEAPAYSVVIEIPAWSFRKMRWHQGKWDQQFRSLLPSPFNYGFVAEPAPAPRGVTSLDGEPLDVVVLGPRLLAGTRVQVTPAACVAFLDNGCRDDKLVARQDGKRLRSLDWLVVRVFFAVYGLFKRLRQRFQGTRQGRTGVLGYSSLTPAR